MEEKVFIELMDICVAFVTEICLQALIYIEEKFNVVSLPAQQLVVQLVAVVEITIHFLRMPDGEAVPIAII